MKQIQGAFFTGYVTLTIEGNSPELYLQRCASHDVLVWNVKKISQSCCSANIRLKDIELIQEKLNDDAYTITITQKYGLPVLVEKLLSRKEFIISIGVCLLLILYLSNIIWNININGAPKDIEKKITKQLNAYGVHTGALTFSLDSPSIIQQKLLHDIPELLWIGVEKKGTTFNIEVVEKTIVEEKEVNGPSNLVAAKEGVVTYVYVSKGMPKVKVNDYVEPDDLLVSGNISDDKKEPEFVEAEGEIIAKTWYEVSVTVPLKAEYQELTGEKDETFHIELGNISIPIWGFGSNKFEQVQTDVTRTPFHFFKWELPIIMRKSVHYEKMYRKENRSMKEAIDIGIEQAKNELLLHLDKNAKVISEKVLHESSANGKVKLILYLTVEENIAKSVPINQGD